MHWIAYKEGDTDIPEGVPLLIQRKGCVPIPLYHVVKFAKDLFKVDEHDFYDCEGVPGFYELDVEWGYIQMRGVIAYAVIDEYKPAPEYVAPILSEEDEDKVRKWCRANCIPGPLCPDTYCVEARKGALGKEEK